MGDPKFTKKKFSAPPHPWQKSRIDEEKQLLKEFGLRNKNEVWKMRTKILNFATQTKRLTAQTTDQSKKEEQQLLEKLYKLRKVLEDTISILEPCDTQDEICQGFRKVASIMAASPLGDTEWKKSVEGLKAWGTPGLLPQAELFEYHTRWLADTRKRFEPMDAEINFYRTEESKLRNGKA